MRRWYVGGTFHLPPIFPALQYSWFKTKYETDSVSSKINAFFDLNVPIVLEVVLEFR
jgi:hypothetical protein